MHSTGEEGEGACSLQVKTWRGAKIYIAIFFCAILSFLGFKPWGKAQHCAQDKEEKL